MTAGPAGAAACLIGVTAATEQARWLAWDQPADLAPTGYSQTVQRAGGVALLLPPDPGLTANPFPLIDRLDGLILTGGADVDPASYASEAHPQTADIRPERDRFELALAKAAIDRELPLLGICRGFQLMNVAAGGTLEQHLPDVIGHEGHRTVPGQFDEHEVEFVPGSKVAGICQTDRKSVTSHHHQGLDRVGQGLAITGTSSDDGVPEALEVESAEFAVAVQWHPEIDPDDLLVQALVDAARARMAA